MNALKSVEQRMWEMSQFFASARDVCVARAIEHDLSGRQRLENCGMEVERRVNSYQHVHVNIVCNAVSMGRLIALTSLASVFSLVDAGNTPSAAHILQTG